MIVKFPNNICSVCQNSKQEEEVNFHFFKNKMKNDFQAFNLNSEEITTHPCSSHRKTEDAALADLSTFLPFSNEGRHGKTGDPTLQLTAAMGLYGIFPCMLVCSGLVAEYTSAAGIVRPSQATGQHTSANIKSATIVIALH